LLILKNVQLTFFHKLTFNQQFGLLIIINMHISGKADKWTDKLTGCAVKKKIQYQNRKSTFFSFCLVYKNDN